jgi:exoribonuclease R
MLKTPLKPANYIAAGEIPDEAWAHFALNIPYYTHFTSPIRRYADVMVHRLLQATIEGEEYVENFPYETRDIGAICGKCNTKKDASRKAQDRSDEVFLALYLRRHPIKSKLGVVLSVGEKTFTVFVPSLGVSAKLFLEEHQDWVKASPFVLKNDRRIKLERTSRHNGETWSEIVIKFFTKLRVTCICDDKPPISVKIVLEGPWVDNALSTR